MKVGEAILEAAKKQAEGEVSVHIANIKVYQTMPAGIGEHSDVTEAVIAELDKLAAADDRWKCLTSILMTKTNKELYLGDSFCLTIA